MGQFQLVALAGKGSMGTVYRATQTTMGRTVAVNDPAARICSATPMRWPVFYGRRGRRRGCRTRTSDRPRPWARPTRACPTSSWSSSTVACWARWPIAKRRCSTPDGPSRSPARIASALGEAHQHGIVHRDLKPETSSWSPRGETRLRQGARLRHRQAAPWRARARPAITATGRLRHARYMSPEQCGGARCRRARRPVLARRDPLSPGDGPAAIRGQLGHAGADAPYAEPPPRPRSVRPDVPAPIEAVVLRAMEKDRSSRWHDAEELIGALDRAEGELEDDPSRTLQGVVPARPAYSGAPHHRVAAPI